MDTDKVLKVSYPDNGVLFRLGEKVNGISRGGFLDEREEHGIYVDEVLDFLDECKNDGVTHVVEDREPEKVYDIDTYIEHWEWYKDEAV
jgi:hypothetical protein